MVLESRHNRPRAVNLDHQVRLPVTPIGIDQSYEKILRCIAFGRNTSPLPARPNRAGFSIDGACARRHVICAPTRVSALYFPICDQMPDTHWPSCRSHQAIALTPNEQSSARKRHWCLEFCMRASVKPPSSRSPRHRLPQRRRHRPAACGGEHVTASSSHASDHRRSRRPAIVRREVAVTTATPLRSRRHRTHRLLPEGRICGWSTAVAVQQFSDP